MSLPTLQQLIAFRAVAENGGFSSAADELRMSQPAVSQQIRLLEQQLGVPLFERRPRGVVLTTAGEALLPLARTSLASIDELVMEAERQRSGFTRLRLAAIPTIAPYLLPRAIEHLRSAHADAQLLISEMRTSDILAALEANQLDLAIIATDEESDLFATMTLGADPFLLAVPRDDALAARAAVSSSRLLEREILLLQDGHCLRGQAQAVCAAVGRPSTQDVSASSLSTVCQMVAAGQGVTLLPQLAVEVECRDGSGIRALRISDGGYSRTLRFVWRRTSGQAAELHALAAEMLVPLGFSKPQSKASTRKR